MCKAVGSMITTGNTKLREAMYAIGLCCAQWHTPAISASGKGKQEEQEPKVSQPWLHRELKHSLGYMRLCLKQTKQVKKQTKPLFT